MPKIKKTSVSLMIESDVWNKTKGYSDFIGIDKGDIVSTGLKMYFKALIAFEKKMDEVADKEKGN